MDTEQNTISLIWIQRINVRGVGVDRKEEDNLLNWTEKWGKLQETTGKWGGKLQGEDRKVRVDFKSDKQKINNKIK